MSPAVTRCLSKLIPGLCKLTGRLCLPMCLFSGKPTFFFFYLIRKPHLLISNASNQKELLSINNNFVKCIPLILHYNSVSHRVLKFLIKLLLNSTSFDYLFGDFRASWLHTFLLHDKSDMTALLVARVI